MIRKGMFWIGAVLFLGVVLVAVDLCSYPTLQRVVGTYKGTYAGGTETLVIRIDGSYTQTFIREDQVIYVNNGLWRIARGREIEFTNFRRLMSNSGWVYPRPKLLLSPTGVWHWPGGEIEFGECGNYFVVKQEGPPGTEGE